MYTIYMTVYTWLGTVTEKIARVTAVQLLVLLSRRLIPGDRFGHCPVTRTSHCACVRVRVCPP